MSTTGQTLLSRGFAALQRVHPSAWTWDGDGALPGGDFADVPADDPHMLDEPPPRHVVAMLTADLPTPAPERGQTLVHTVSGLSHRILHVAVNRTEGKTRFYLAAGFTAAGGES